MNLKYKTDFLSVEEYLQGEFTSPIRHELIDGEVYAMAGASSNHNRIVANISRELGNQLKNTSCESFVADMKVQVKNNFYYPDSIVDCNHISNDNGITNSPIIILEVLSQSTRQTDQVLKRTHYQQLESLMEYVVIEQNFVDIEICRRNNGWKSEHFYLDDILYFESVDINIPVLEIYDRIENDDVISYLEKQEREKQEEII